MKNGSGTGDVRIAADTLQVATTRVGRDRRFLWVSAAYARWAGRPAAQLVGRELREILGEGVLQALEPFIARVLGGEQVQFERLVDLPGLRRRWISWVYIPTVDRSGTVDGWVSTGFDVHAQKLAEQQRDEFLATLAHELRNPLAPIRNAVAILGRKGSQDPEVAWSQTVIERQIDQLSRLIDDLLDIERIARGRFVLKKEHVPLEFIVDMAIEASRPTINAAGHHLSVLLPSERVVLEADAPRLSHVFTILLKNAARHMQSRGSIGLTATVESGAVLVAIEDGGVGMDAEHDAGVGLTLVRGITQLHNGAVDIRTAASGQGTEVVVRLPLSGGIPVPRAAPQRVAVVGPSLRVLVADDNRDAADSLQRILALYGHEVRVAYDGSAAVRLGEEFRPRVAILDIGMPGTNGYEVARELRHRNGPRVTLVALTGWGQEADRRRATEAGFDHHLTKPVDPHALNDLLASVAAGASKN
jgi:signal transduction histidine kinase/ActR/RegA family two-component response regulator